MSTGDHEAGGRGSPLPIGSTFAGFRIEAVLGVGGMGTVYRARDLELDSERALKVLDPRLADDDAFRERFRRESRLAAAIEDPALVPIHRAGEEDGRLFIAMRLVRGPDLHKLVSNDGPLEPQRTARIVTAIASALDAAHASGIVHRDVKPANVLVELGSEGERVFLTDFGIGRPANASSPITSTGVVLGTTEYIAPEQIEGRPAEAGSDVYALGCLLFFLLTGEPPFARDNELATLYAHGHAPRPRPSLLEPGLPEAIDEVVVKATAVAPEERYASAGELAAGFRGALSRPASRGSGAPPAGDAPTAVIAKPGRRRRAVVGVAGAIAVIVAGALLLAGGDGENGGGASQPAVDTAVLDDSPPLDSVVVGNVNVLAGAGQESKLYPVDPDTEQVARDPYGVPKPSALAVGIGSVWAASEPKNAVFRFFGPNHRDVPVKIDVGSHPSDVATTARRVWVTNRGDATVTEINPYGAEAVIDVPDHPLAVAASEEAVWVASGSAGSVARIDPAAPRAGAETVDLGGRPHDLALDGSVLWVLDSDAATVTAVSAADGERLGEPIDVGGSPVAIAAGLGSVWVVDREADTVTAIDADTREPGTPIEVGNVPVALAIGGDSVWIANQASGTLTRVTP